MVPDSVLQIFITLSLSFLIGLEREEHAGGRHPGFGGVRTFPIIGLCGYLVARLAGDKPLLISAGVLVVGALLWLSYRKKLEVSSSAGMTSEASGLFTFLLGALIAHGSLWEATALAVVVLLLLELKSGLERLAKKIPPDEIFTFTRFLLISAVILPIVPNRDFTPLHFNPFHMWLVVVAISGLSYGAYVLGRFLDSGQSLIFSSLLGGLYSSTSATVVLAKRSKEDDSNGAYSGAILIASGCMYLRLIALLGFFNMELFRLLWLPFAILALLASVSGILWIKSAKRKSASKHKANLSPKNPLELQSALIFAVLFSLMGVLTGLAIQYLGSMGVLGLSFFTGITDVDPFIMSLTQTSGTTVAVGLAAKGIIIATASNDLIKGVYAAVLGGKGVKKHGSIGLIVLGLLSTLALLFI